MKTGFLVVLALLAGAVLWLLLGQGSPEASTAAHTVGESAETQAEAAPAPAGMEADPAAEAAPASTGARREAIAAAPAAEDESAAPPLFAPEELASLTVVLRNRETEEPLPEMPVRVYVETDDEDGERRVLEWLASRGWGELKERGGGTYLEWDEEHNLTDEDGALLFDLPAGFEYQVSTGGRERDTEFAHEEIDELLPEESRELILRLRCGPDFRFHGRLVAEADGTPIAGAEVFDFDGTILTQNDFLMLRPLSERDEEPQFDPAGRTDADGRFSLEGRSWRWSSFGVAIAEGYAPAFVELTQGHGAPGSAREIEVKLASELTGRVSGADGPGRVLLFTDAYRLTTDRSGPWGHQAAWASEWDAGGAYRVEGLPPDLPLRVELRPESGSRLAIAEPLQLAAGERAIRNWSLGGAATVRGIVLDEGSQPVADVPVAAMPPRNRSQANAGEETPMPRRADSEPAARARTDEDGRFVLENLTEGLWAVGVMTHERDEELPVSRSGVLVQVPPGAKEVQATVKVYRNLFVAGRIEMPDGRPAKGAGVNAWGRQGASYVTRADPEGRFRIGPLSPGNYYVSAHVWQELVRFQVVETEAGKADLLIVGEAAGGIIVNIKNADGSLPARLTVRTKGDDGEEHVWSTGSFGRDDLELSPWAPGTYDFHFESGTGDTAILYGQVVPVGVKTRLPDVRLETSGTIEIVLPDGVRYASCVVRAGAARFPQHVRAGQDDLIRVPPGPYELEVRYPLQDVQELQTIHVDVLAGAHERVVLTPPPPPEEAEEAAPPGGG